MLVAGSNTKKQAAQKVPSLVKKYNIGQIISD
jgi:hypothetical protein